SSQMNRRALELENHVKQRLKRAQAEHERMTGQKSPPYPLIMAMEPLEYERWCYVREAARRADETASRLEKELFQRLAELRHGEQTDLVAAMAQSDPAEPVEPVPEDDPDKSD